MFKMFFLNALTSARKASIGTAMFEILDEVRGDLQEMLRRGATNRRSPMHVPVVITSDVDARGMVLREFDAETWTLRFHTDIRAPKVAAIESDPRMAVLFYDKDAKVQIRAKGRGRILSAGPQVDAAWTASDNFARRCYLGAGPGTPSDTPSSGLPPEIEGIEPSDEELVPARPNFAILLVELTDLDWFYLAHTGHIRAQFERRDNEWFGKWVTP